MPNKKAKSRKKTKEPEDNFAPALKALIEKIDGSEWQIVTFEIAGKTAKRG